MQERLSCWPAQVYETLDANPGYVRWRIYVHTSILLQAQAIFVAPTRGVLCKRRKCDDVSSGRKREYSVDVLSSALFSPTHRKGKADTKDSAYGTITWSSTLICILPACCDVGGTTLSGIGLLFTSASVFQMLRGSIIVFTALLSVIFLKTQIVGIPLLGITFDNYGGDTSRFVVNHGRQSKCF